MNRRNHNRNNSDPAEARSRSTSKTRMTRLARGLTWGRQSWQPFS